MSVFYVLLSTNCCIKEKEAFLLFIAAFCLLRKDGFDKNYTNQKNLSVNLIQNEKTPKLLPFQKDNKSSKINIIYKK